MSFLGCKKWQQKWWIYKNILQCRIFKIVHSEHENWVGYLILIRIAFCVKVVWGVVQYWPGYLNTYLLTCLIDLCIFLHGVEKNSLRFCRLNWRLFEENLFDDFVQTIIKLIRYIGIIWPSEKWLRLNRKWHDFWRKFHIRHRQPRGTMADSIKKILKPLNHHFIGDFLNNTPFCSFFFQICQMLNGDCHKP